MALPKLTKTNYTGIFYYNDKLRGKVYVGKFELYKKKYRKVIGYEKDEYRTNASIAYVKKEQLKNEIKNGGLKKEINISFDDLWNTYLDHIKSSASCSLKTIKNKESIYDTHFKSLFNSRDIRSIENFEIQRLANSLLKKRAPKTVKNVISDLAAIFSFAIKHKKLNDNPARNIDLPKFDNEKIFPLSHEESKRLFNTILNFKEPLFRGIFTFLLQGRRKDEVLSITWDKINLEQKIYTIHYLENKAKKNMTYEMTDDLYEILINIPNKEGLVFPSPKTGKKLQNIRYAWHRILKEANIHQDITLHELRHLLGYTLLNEAKQSEEITAAVLGQTTTRATKRYAKVRQKVAANGLKKAFEALRNSSS